MPGGASEATETFSVDSRNPFRGGVIGLGENTPTVPDGRLVNCSDTGRLKLLTEVTLTLNVVELPRKTLFEGGVIERLKEGVIDWLTFTDADAQCDRDPALPHTINWKTPAAVPRLVVMVSPVSVPPLVGITLALPNVAVLPEGMPEIFRVTGDEKPPPESNVTV